MFRGTRVPVHLIATLAEKESPQDIVKSYPRLTAEMVRSATVYAKGHPLQGIPRKQPWHGRAPVRRVRVALARLKDC